MTTEQMFNDLIDRLLSGPPTLDKQEAAHEVRAARDLLYPPEPKPAPALPSAIEFVAEGARPRSWHVSGAPKACLFLAGYPNELEWLARQSPDRLPILCPDLD